MSKDGKDGPTLDTSALPLSHHPQFLSNSTESHSKGPELAGEIFFSTDDVVAKRNLQESDVAVRPVHNTIGNSCFL